MPLGFYRTEQVPSIQPKLTGIMMDLIDGAAALMDMKRAAPSEVIRVAEVVLIVVKFTVEAVYFRIGH